MALVPSRRFSRVLTLFDLANHQLKRLLHILIVSCRGLGPAAIQLGLEGLAVFGGDLALLGAEIGLVSYNDEGDVFSGLKENVLVAPDRAESADGHEDFRRFDSFARSWWT